MRKVKKMVKVGQRVLSAILMVVLVAEMPMFTSYAAEPTELDLEESKEVEVLEAVLMEDINMSFEVIPYTMLTDCTITARGASDGMHIDISTGSVGTASVLGIKDVKIQKKTWYGGWTTVATSVGKELTNCSFMGISLLYENAVKDAKYRISCIHYGDVDGYIEGENVTSEITFTY